MISQQATLIRTNKMGKPYVQSTDPSITKTLVANDMWLNPSEGTMKMWNGTGWTEMQFGESAIMDDCITNRMLANDISASKVTAGILQSQDGSFYLNLETGEAELLKLVMGGQVEGNIIATSSNGLTRVRLRGREGERNVTAGLIFEQREDASDDTGWENAGQIYFGYSTRQTYAALQNITLGVYDSSRPNMAYNSGTTDGHIWRSISNTWTSGSVKECRLTYHGTKIRQMTKSGSTWTTEDLPYVMNAIGNITTGTSIVTRGIATCTYQPNDIMRIDFNAKVTTAGSGSASFGISTALLRTLNSDIPSLTPIDGGSIEMFSSSGALLTSYPGATMKADGSYWHPAYIANSAITAINESVLTSGVTIRGTCYASYVFE